MLLCEVLASDICKVGDQQVKGLLNHPTWLKISSNWS